MSFFFVKLSKISKIHKNQSPWSEFSDTDDGIQLFTLKIMIFHCSIVAPLLSWIRFFFCLLCSKVFKILQKCFKDLCSSKISRITKKLFSARFSVFLVITLIKQSYNQIVTCAAFYLQENEYLQPMFHGLMYGIKQKIYWQNSTQYVITLPIKEIHLQWNRLTVQSKKSCPSHMLRRMYWRWMLLERHSIIQWN